MTQCDQRTQLIALVYLSDSRDQISQALVDQDGVKTVDLRMVYEPGFEKYRDDEIRLGENENRSVEPCRLALEDSQQGNLRDIKRKEEEEGDAQSKYRQRYQA